MSWDELPEYAKLLISAGVGVALMILAVIVLCQCLWLCRKRKKGFEQAQGSEPDGENELPDISPHRHLPKKKIASEKWKAESIRSRTSLSSSGSEGYGSLKAVGQKLSRKVKRSASQTSTELPPLDEIQFLQVPEKTQEPGTLGSIVFSLSYEKAEENVIIKVISAHNLKVRPFGGTPNPYVNVSLHKSGVEKSDFEFQTNMQTRTITPDFDQTFDASIKASSLSRYTIRLVVCDHHRLGQSDVMGEAELRLKGADWDKDVEKQMELEPSTQIPCGELLVSLSYLPTSERLYIAVLRATGFNDAHEPFVRVSLVIAGKNLPRRRIASTQQRSALVFAEALFFEVPREKLERVKILIVAMETTGGVDEPDVGGAPVEIGQILLGRGCSHYAHAHWEEMIQTPRTPIAQWYPIY